MFSLLAFLGVMVFEALCPQFDFSDALFHRLAGIFDTNAIEIRMSQSEVMALYETACLLEHNCAPNLRMTFDENFHVRTQDDSLLVSCFESTWKVRTKRNVPFTYKLWTRPEN